ncbi:Alpha/Beta hydrolase protein [Podospora fimiseda]|uniref:Alpha/Beta hydrolase protein n=1 Tax=Podospora fimiseda TaxID=252190 RepID=A0AAN7BHB1_9PEZI|nr:Alpha/Beta hydrolase protein [Podospora fimiseda]
MAVSSDSHVDEGDLKVLYSPSNGPADLDIVAVHGLGGDASATWTYPSKGSNPPILWLRDLLPQKLPNARIMTFQYNSQILSNTSKYSVRENSAKLLQILTDLREDDEAEGRPIVFLGHSLGGIIIKQALRIATPLIAKQSPYSDISTSTKGLIFFGTPHRGADGARWLTLVTNITSSLSPQIKASPFVKALQTHSEELFKITQDFRLLTDNYAIISFYEQDVHPILGDVIVEKLSAVMGLRHEEALMLGGDHSGMCKFMGMTDPRFNTVWRAIRRASKGKRF